MKTFGQEITRMRISKNIGLRQFFLDLKKNGSDLEIDQLSKIERGIQNPRNKAEFLLIIKCLGITDSLLINELEKLAITPLRTKSEITKILPPSNIQTEDQYNDLIKFLNNGENPDW